MEILRLEQVTEMLISHRYRVLMAEGLLNWSGPNDTQNELVNPGVWKWKTPQDVLVERA